MIKKLKFEHLDMSIIKIHYRMMISPKRSIQANYIIQSRQFSKHPTRTFCIKCFDGVVCLKLHSESCEQILKLTIDYMIDNYNYRNPKLIISNNLPMMKGYDFPTFTSDDGKIIAVIILAVYHPNNFGQYYYVVQINTETSVVSTFVYHIFPQESNTDYSTHKHNLGKLDSGSVIRQRDLTGNCSGLFWMREEDYSEFAHSVSFLTNSNEQTLIYAMSDDIESSLCYDGTQVYTNSQGKDVTQILKLTIHYIIDQITNYQKPNTLQSDVQKCHDFPTFTCGTGNITTVIIKTYHYHNGIGGYYYVAQRNNLTGKVRVFIYYDFVLRCKPTMVTANYDNVNNNFTNIIKNVKRCVFETSKIQGLNWLDNKDITYHVLKI